MTGTVNAMLVCCPGTLPQVYEFAPCPGRSLVAAFEDRAATLAAELGEPRLETRLDWYPHAEAAACWVRGSKTVVLVREREGRCGARVVLWCVTDDERATLAEAERTRAARVAEAAFDRDCARRLAELSEPGFGKFLRRRALADDLALSDRADDLLALALADADGEIRCHAVDLVLELNGVRALPRVTPLFDDSEDWVRHHVVGSMGHYGDGSVVGELLVKLRSDPDAGVRGEAAYSLGHIGDPRAIPDLLHALDHDTEPDALGHTPSSTSATALDNILGTHETRVAHGDGLCSLAPRPPDYESLKRRARELYERWQAGGARS